ncbi:MAG: rhombosortase [Nibricoccus sp.]
MKKFPFIAVIFTALALFVFRLAGWTEALEMNRIALAQGELWRLFTGHLTHFSADHLKWDLAVFVALGSLVELRSRRHFVAVLAGGALAISVGVWWLQPQFASYRGLSGVDSALFGYVAMDIFLIACAEKRYGTVLIAGLALMLFVAKTSFELVSGRTVFVDNSGGFAPVPLAHLIGAIVGGVCVVRGHRLEKKQAEGLAG